MGRFLYIVVVLVLIGAAWSVTAQGVLTVGKHDDISPVIIYSTGWRQITSSAAYNGSYTRDNFGTQSVSYNVQFEGDGFILQYVTSSSGGTGQIDVNGTFSDSISFQSPSTTNGVEYQATGFGAGTHTLTFTSDGTGLVSIDAIEILPLPPTPTPIPVVNTPLPDVNVWSVYQDGEGNDVNAVFEYRITAGDVMISLCLMPILAMTAVIFITAAWRDQ